MIAHLKRCFQRRARRRRPRKEGEEELDRRLRRWASQRAPKASQVFVRYSRAMMEISLVHSAEKESPRSPKATLKAMSEPMVVLKPQSSKQATALPPQLRVTTARRGQMSER